MWWSGLTWTGTYRYEARSDSWTWSREVYQLFELDENTPVTFTDLTRGMVDVDVKELWRIVEECSVSGGVFGEQYRVATKSGQPKVVIISGQQKLTPGEQHDVEGFVIDVTKIHTQDVVADANDKVERALESRGTIDQAKGALMLLHGMNDSDAFATLKWCSQRSNEKLSKVADRIASAVSMGLQIDAKTRARLDSILSDLSLGTIGSSIQPSRSSINSELSTDHELSVVVLAVGGQVDLATVPAFSDAVNDMLIKCEPPMNAVLDLRSVEYLGASAAPVIVNASKRCKRTGQTLNVLIDKAAYEDTEIVNRLNEAGVEIS